MVRFIGRVLPLLLVGVLCGALPAQAAESAKGPEWVKKCGKVADGKEVCVVRQFVMDEQQHRPLLLAQFGYTGPKDKPRLIMSVPLGVLLTTGISISIDKKKPLTAPFEVCTPEGCLSFIDMDEPALEHFLKGKVMTVRFMAAPGRPLELPVHLQGLAAALKGTKTE